MGNSISISPIFTCLKLSSCKRHWKF